MRTHNSSADMQDNAAFTHAIAPLGQCKPHSYLSIIRSIFTFFSRSNRNHYCEISKWQSEVIFQEKTLKLDKKKLRKHNRFPVIFLIVKQLQNHLLILCRRKNFTVFSTEKSPIQKVFFLYFDFIISVYFQLFIFLYLFILILFFSWSDVYTNTPLSQSCCRCFCCFVERVRYNIGWKCLAVFTYSCLCSEFKSKSLKPLGSSI